MKDHDVLFRSIQGIAYISVGPLILLTASLWFTEDESAYILAHLAQIYFSVLMFFLCGSIWSFRDYDNNHYKSLAEHPRVMRVVALSGGYSRKDATARLAKNANMIASFSRALTEGLSASQSEVEFERVLGQTIAEISAASFAG